MNSGILISTICLVLTSCFPKEPTALEGVEGLVEKPESTLVSSETSYFSFSPGGDIIFCGKEGVVSLNGATRQETLLLEAAVPGEYIWAWMSPDRKLLLVLNRKGKLALAEIDTKKITPLKEELPKAFKKCAFSPDGTYFVAIGGMEDSELVYWEFGGDKKTVKTTGKSTFANGTTLYDGAFSPDGKVFATVTGSGSLVFWSRPPLVRSMEGTRLARNGGLSSLTFSTDGKTVAVAASFEQKITLLAPATGKNIKQIEWKKSDPLSGLRLAFLPNKNILACTDGNNVSFLDTDSGKVLGSVAAGGSVISLAVSPDGRWLVAGTREKTVVTWRLKD